MIKNIISVVLLSFVAVLACSCSNDDIPENYTESVVSDFWLSEEKNQSDLWIESKDEAYSEIIEDDFADEENSETNDNKTESSENSFEEELSDESLSSMEGEDICDSSEEKYNTEGVVILTEYVPDVIAKVRYYSTYNFVGERIDGYEEPVLIITKEAAEALKKVSDELLTKGYRLKVFDTYRPVRAVDHFVRWSEDYTDDKMKPYFYPDIDKSLLFKKGFIAVNSGHSRGSTIDLTLFCDATGKEVDMGGTFDFFGEISYPTYEIGLTKEQINNRMLLRETMMKYGFKPAKNEWWHFMLVDEPYPNTYFDFPVNSNYISNN